MKIFLQKYPIRQILNDKFIIVANDANGTPGYYQIQQRFRPSVKLIVTELRYFFRCTNYHAWSVASNHKINQERCCSSDTCTSQQKARYNGAMNAIDWKIMVVSDAEWTAYCRIWEVVNKLFDIESSLVVSNWVSRLSRKAFWTSKIISIIYSPYLVPDPRYRDPSMLYRKTFPYWWYPVCLPFSSLGKRKAEIFACKNFENRTHYFHNLPAKKE